MLKLQMGSGKDKKIWFHVHAIGLVEPAEERKAELLNKLFTISTNPIHHHLLVDLMLAIGCVVDTDLETINRLANSTKKLS